MSRSTPARASCGSGRGPAVGRCTGGVGEQVWVQAQERNGTRDTTATVTMPAVAGASEGTLTGWLKQVGYAVQAGEPLLEVATDEVDAQLSAPSSGILRQILVAENETVWVGTTLAVISPPAYEIFDDWEEAAEPAWEQVAGQAWELARAQLWRQINRPPHGRCRLGAAGGAARLSSPEARPCQRSSFRAADSPAMSSAMKGALSAWGY